MKIQHKLFSILFAFSFALISALVVLMQWSMNQGMLEYVSNKEVEQLTPLLSKLEQEYLRHNNWSSFKNNHRKFRRFIDTTLNSDMMPPPNVRPSREDGPPIRGGARPARGEEPSQHRPPGPRPPGPRPPEHGRPNEPDFVLLDSTGKPVVGKNFQVDKFIKIDITVNNNTVGYLAISKREKLSEGYEFDFIKQQQNFLWLIALLLLLVVVVVTIPLANHLVIPLKKVTKGMQNLTQGNYKALLNLKRSDELGELSKHYNELALTLSQNETLRKRWLADISHELRTPVAILSGEIESMLDGVRPTNKTNIQSTYEEVQHLKRLLDDFHQLTYADIGGMRYQKEDLDLVALLNAEYEKHQSYLAKAGIVLKTNITVNECIVFGDKTRLQQLCENLLNNAVKYAKATELSVSLMRVKLQQQTWAQLIIADNGVGVEESHLAKIFDYLYRVENSRNRLTGGSGLGLSICQSIVEAHQGKISAQPSDSGGLAITILLPTNK